MSTKRRIIFWFYSHVIGNETKNITQYTNFYKKHVFKNKFY